ncbi:MAG: hypothetical protein GY834_07005 [Bacteroidetes bacterium]|nr:hypothetical protein [Bacteroidota bacterium]
MISLSVGCNFDGELIEFVNRINKTSTNVKVKEFYGSIRDHHEFTARPAYRLPDLSKKKFESFISKCNDSNLSFNYTLNTLYPSSKKQLVKNSKLIFLVKYLMNIGINNITISNPIIAEFIRDNGIDINLTISTIAHVDTVTQIKIWHETYGINKLHSNILKNRSIKFLTNANKYCEENNIELSLIANEFCGNGTNSIDNAYSSTHCIYRDSCFLLHAENLTIEDDKSLNGYPMNHCIDSRSNIETWLKTMFIRPEDLSKYSKIGISSYKITGRTGTTEYLKRIIEAYISESWNGNH